MTPRATWHAGGAAALAIAAAVPAAGAADAARGARLYLQLPSGATGCIGCHGPDPGQNRNNLLQAAARPEALIRAINTVAAMGVLRQGFGQAEAEDVAAYLDAVRAAAAASPQVWPPTLAMGTMTAGAAAGAQRLRLAHPGDQPLALNGVWLLGDGFALRHDCPPVLPPRAGCELALTALTAQPGRRSAALRIDSSAGSRWLGMSAVVLDGAAVGVLETEPPAPLLDFGTHATGTLVAREVALINRGVADVVVDPVSVSGPQAARFRVEDSCALRGPIEPGARCVVRITWQSAQDGVADAAVHWNSSGQNAAPLHLRATATPDRRRRAPVLPRSACAAR